MTDDPSHGFHVQRAHEGQGVYELDALRHHLLIDHHQLPEGVNHVSPNLLVALHDNGSFGEHWSQTEPASQEPSTPSPDYNQGSTSSFAEAEKGSRIAKLEAELLELRTGLEMMAIGMRAMENELRNHVTSGPHHSHPEP